MKQTLIHFLTDPGAETACWAFLIALIGLVLSLPIWHIVTLIKRRRAERARLRAVHRVSPVLMKLWLIVALLPLTGCGSQELFTDEAPARIITQHGAALAQMPAFWLREFADLSPGLLWSLLFLLVCAWIASLMCAAERGRVLILREWEQQVAQGEAQWQRVKRREAAAKSAERNVWISEPGNRGGDRS